MRSKKHIYILLAVLAASIILASSLAAQGVFYKIIGFVANIISRQPVLGAAVFVLLAALSILLGPFTSSPLLPPAVAVWGNGLTLAILVFGWLLGDMLAYYIGFRFGYPIVSKFVNKRKLDEWIAYARGNLPFSLMLLFRLATPSETGYIFGLLKYDFKKYMLTTIIAEGPFAVLAVYGSFALLNQRWSDVALTLVGWGIVATIAVLFFRKKFHHNIQGHAT